MFEFSVPPECPITVSPQVGEVPLGEVSTLFYICNIVIFTGLCLKTVSQKHLSIVLTFSGYIYSSIIYLLNFCIIMHLTCYTTLIPLECECECGVLPSPGPGDCEGGGSEAGTGGATQSHRGSCSTREGENRTGETTTVCSESVLYIL